MSPDLSATVAPGTKVRLTYALSWQVISFGEPDYLVGLLNDAWYGSGYAFVLSPATTPEAAPSTVLGAYSNAYATLDVQVDQDIPTMTWDAFLNPLRSISAPLYDLLHLGDGVTLNDFELIAAAGTAAGASTAQPAARTAATAGAVQQAVTNPTDPFNRLFTYLESNLGNVGLIVVGVAVIAGVVVFGPGLVEMFKSLSHKEA